MPHYFDVVLEASPPPESESNYRTKVACQEMVNILERFAACFLTINRHENISHTDGLVQIGRCPLRCSILIGEVRDSFHAVIA